MKLALGTVQFGLDYGAFNKEGRVPADEVNSILALAAANGVTLLDTAHEYGAAEEAIAGRPEFRVVTKTAQVRKARVEIEDVERVKQAFASSLERMRTDAVYGLLSHLADDLLVPGGERIWEAMEDFKAAGKVKKIGASVYDGAQIDALLARYPLEIVQVPLNVFDQRLIAGGQLQRLKEKGVEVHARSAFLQGLLVSPLAELPAHLERARSPLASYFSALEKAGLTPLAAALQFVTQRPEVNQVVVGVQSRAQLAEILSAQGTGAAVDFSRFSLDDEMILNPALWNLRTLAP